MVGHEHTALYSVLFFPPHIGIIGFFWCASGHRNNAHSIFSSGILHRDTMKLWSKIHIYSQFSVTVRAKLFHFPYSVDISHPMPPTFWLTVSGLGMSLSLRNILEKDLLLWLKCKSHSYFHNMIKKFLKIFGTAIGLTMFSSYRLVMCRPYPRNFHDLCQSTLWRAWCRGCDSLYGLEGAHSRTFPLQQPSVLLLCISLSSIWWTEQIHDIHDIIYVDILTNHRIIWYITQCMGIIILRACL